jgi:hypothetical protein
MAVEKKIDRTAPRADWGAEEEEGKRCKIYATEKEEDKLKKWKEK